MPVARDVTKQKVESTLASFQRQYEISFLNIYPYTHRLFKPHSSKNLLFATDGNY